MKKLMFTIFAVALVCSAGMLSSCGSSDEDKTYDPATDGLVGTWVSEGTNVASFLVQYFNIVRIDAKFNGNNTYLVESYDNLQVKTTYTGTYVQTKSNVGTIWNIRLNQGSPTAVTSDGIFQITQTGNQFTMKYEVVQTEPPAGVAPTAAAGFGSSNGGALGDVLIQTFTKVGEN
jgi:hypothetical protein